jgi:hypothetical protein
MDANWGTLDAGALDISSLLCGSLPLEGSQTRASIFLFFLILLFLRFFA